MSGVSNTTLINRVNTEATKLEQDQQFIAEHKNDPSALAGRIAEFQSDWENFQKDSASLQGSGSDADVATAQTAEARAFSAFETTHGDLKSAVEQATSSNDPSAQALQAGFASITDQGNANVLHLQALNNNIDAINAKTGGTLQAQYTIDGSVQGDADEKNIALKDVVYGDVNAGGIATGGTRQASDVHAESVQILNDALTSQGRAATAGGAENPQILLDRA